MSRSNELLFPCQSLDCQTKRNGNQHLLTADTVRWIEYRRRRLPVCQEAFDKWYSIPSVSLPQSDSQASKQAA